MKNFINLSTKNTMSFLTLIRNQKPIVLSLIIAVVLFMPNLTANASFIDVNEDTKYSDAIGYLQEQGIINGYADGTFKPDNTLNRAELLKILIEAANPDVILDSIGDLKTNSEYQNCFPDVKGEWFAPYICYAKEKGIIGGYPDGTFKPANTINFSEASKIIVNAMDIEIPEIETDIWYEPYVRALTENKRVPRTITSFDKLLTRGEMAEIVWREKEDVEKSEDWMSWRGIEIQLEYFGEFNNQKNEYFFATMA